ncbi:MAG TPA: PPC domain-containing protein, partial [Thermoanaerobaculia bacterium]|nr:PPC domain-containing protein [Thermoanaerobaculia bacterium]
AGGEIAPAADGNRQGFLTFLRGMGGAVLNSMTYSPGGGLLDARLASLDRTRDAADRGYLFYINAFMPGVVPIESRNLVKTDRLGSSGACECKTDVQAFPAQIDSFGLQPVLIPAEAEPFSVVAKPVELDVEPCGVLPCQTAPLPHPVKPAAASRSTLPAGLLPGISGAFGIQRGLPLRTPPLQAGARLGGLAGQKGEHLTFLLQIPKGTRDLAIRTTGGTGNVDLLVGRGRPNGAGARSKARASRRAGNAETVHLHRPTPGSWYITLQGSAAFTGVTLTVENDR